MASPRSRNKSAGLTAGFFGQLNANTARRKTLADNITRMNEKAKVERAKSDYERAAKLKASEVSRTKAVNNANRSENGVRAFVAQELASTPGWGALNPEAQRARIDAREATAMERISTTGSPKGGNRITQGVEDDIDVGNTAALSPQGVFDPAVSSGPSLADVTGAPPPASPASGEPAVRASEGRTGVPNVTGVTTGGAFNPLAVELAERTGIRRVAQMNESGDFINAGETFTAAWNPKTQQMEIQLATGGEWTPMPSNFAEPDKQRSLGGRKEKDKFVAYTDVENRELKNLQLAGTLLNDLGEISTVGNRGPKLLMQRAFVGMQEQLTALGIRKGGDVNMNELIAMHEGVSGEVTVDRLSGEDITELTGLFSRDPTSAESAVFTRGQRIALQKILPVVFARAATGGGKINQRLVDTYTDVFSPSPGQTMGAALKAAKKITVDGFKAIHFQKYRPNTTPKLYQEAGWSYGLSGVVFDRDKDQYYYQMVHSASGLSTRVPTRLNPSLKQLSKKLAELKAERDGKKEK